MISTLRKGSGSTDATTAEWHIAGYESEEPSKKNNNYVYYFFESLSHLKQVLGMVNFCDFLFE